MSDDSSYGIVEAERDSAIEGARSVASRLRKTADEIERLANEAEASTDSEGKIGELGNRVTTSVLAGVAALHLPQVIRSSTAWAKESALYRITARI